MINKIKNKQESMKYIKELNLNTLPEKYFEGFDEEKIRKFIEKYPAEFYAVRDKEKAASTKHKLAVPASEVVEYCKDLNKYTVNVSSYCYRKNQICVGEILIYDNMDIEYIVSNNPEFSVRDAYSKPDYKGKTDIYNKKLSKIKGMDIIIDYILLNNLTNIIVEFTVFNCRVGKNNENVVIWELRNEY